MYSATMWLELFLLELSKPQRGVIYIENKIQFWELHWSGMNIMPNTYSQIYVQVIFAVKGRENMINPNFSDELYKYITGIVTNKGQKLIAINGMPDHIHILLNIKPSQSLSDLVRDIKTNSSRFINEKQWVNQTFRWQTGFGAFSYSKSQLRTVIGYINNQQKHHSKKSFREEYIDFLEKFDVDFDLKYLPENIT
jgi:REP element-mobilizing transposase RayT